MRLASLAIHDLAMARIWADRWFGGRVAELGTKGKVFVLEYMARDLQQLKNLLTFAQNDIKDAAKSVREIRLAQERAAILKR